MENIYASKYLIFLFVAFCFSFLINKLFLNFSKNLGGRAKNENMVRWASVTKPAFGGISFFIVFLLSYSSYPLFFDNSLTFATPEMLGILIASTLAFLMGLADDAYDTNPSLKFIVQFASAIVLIISGTYIQLFDSTIVNYIITILWVVGMMNSINMLDNMDGISTLASTFAFTSMLIVGSYYNEVQSIYFLLTSCMISGLVGFLYFNWNPSKMYMGDTGSQFLGIVLSAMSIHFLWNPLSIVEEIAISKQFVLVILAFLVPLSDTTTVVINRLSKGNSPFIGGKDHTTHHLSYLGFSDRQVALIIGLIASVNTLLIIYVLTIEDWSGLFTLLFGGYAFLVFLSLFLITKRTKPKAV
jgi:UDP-GlcNAc:undecaprenyl-phosphate GlcNAc-1-phosphate transferase